MLFIFCKIKYIHNSILRYEPIDVTSKGNKIKIKSFVDLDTMFTFKHTYESISIKSTSICTTTHKKFIKHEVMMKIGFTPKYYKTFKLITLDTM